MGVGELPNDIKVSLDDKTTYVKFFTIPSHLLYCACITQPSQYLIDAVAFPTPRLTQLFTGFPYPTFLSSRPCMLHTFQISSPTPSTTAPSAILPLLVPPTGNEAFKEVSPMGPFSFKPPQAACRHTQYLWEVESKGFC